MQITRQSMMSGVWRTLDLPVNEEQIRLWAECGVLAQYAFPHLSAADREFIMTGIVQEEWDTLADPDEEE